MDGVATRGESVRFDLLDQANVKIGELHPSKTSIPTINNDTSRAIKRTLQGVTLLPDEEADVDTITNKLQPVWLLEDDSEWPLGIFMWGDATRTRGTYGLNMSATLVDQSFMVDQKIPESVSYVPGDRIDVALEAQAVLAGIDDVSVTPSTASIGGTGATWPAGDSRLKVMTDLCALAGYFDPYFDNDGTLICRPAVDPSTVDITLDYPEGAAASGRIIVATMSESDDLLTAPNRYIATSNAATASEVLAQFDIPADAPNSIERRGFVIPEMVSLSALDNNDAALAAAQARYAQGRTSYRWVEFDAVADPRHDTYDVVGYLGDRGRETSWSLQLTTGGLHHHSLRMVF
jgi:hypothetical protein